MAEPGELGDIIFAQRMGDLSGKTFRHVYDNNKDFVDFTQASMSCGTGVFKMWLDYVKLRSTPNHA